MPKRDRKKKQQHSEGSSSASSGLMGSLRGGMKSVAGTGKDRPRSRGRTQRIWDVAFWVLVIAALVVFLMRRF